MKNKLQLSTTILFIISASLCKAQIPNLWGLTSGGGDEGVGTLIQTNSTGSSFKKDYTFIYPGYSKKNIMQASNGLIYGLNVLGGAYNRGILFSYDTSTGTEALLHSFGGGADGNQPLGSPLQVNDSLLYGLTTGGGDYGGGILFSYNILTGKYNDLHDFGNGNDGLEAGGSLIQATNGLLYGITNGGGANGRGTIFSYNISTNIETDLHDFGNGDGIGPSGSLIQASNGLLYGMTTNGGTNAKGIIFNYDISAGKESVLHSFGSGSDGYSPYGSLIQGSNSLLYGTTRFGGANDTGTIFSYNISTGTETDLHDFKAITTDGAVPNGTLLLAGNGLLYGVTEQSGANNAGVIFSYNITSGKETDVFNLTINSNNNSPLPLGGLIQSGNGLIYGCTAGGGANNGGNLFSYNITTDKETDVHDFRIIYDGALPTGSLLKASNGLLYGTTYSGGASIYGTIFNYNFSTGADSILYNFTGGNSDGEVPFLVSLIQANNGLLYGMTSRGGGVDSGSIFSYNITTGKETNLFDFSTANGTEGAYPYGSLIQAKNGLLYGMTVYGGTDDYGIIFSYDISTNKVTDLHYFDATDGAYPYGSFIQASNGLLYGMAALGGEPDLDGVIFSYNTSTSSFSDLYNFTGGTTDGKDPYGSLIQASNGLLYGMTNAGGSGSGGIIFSYNTSTNIETDVHNFGSGTDGYYPYGSFVQGSDSVLYGMTNAGGTLGYGTVFSYNISTGTESVIHDFEFDDGANPYGNLIEDDTVIVHITPLAASLCNGDSINLIPNGAETYSWSPAAGLSSTTGDAVTASPTVTTTYTITGTTNGHSATATIVITVNPNPTITVTANPPSYCPGNASVLTALGGIEYTWSPSTDLSATTGTTVSANPTVTTTYTVTGANSVGCTATHPVTVTVKPVPVLTITTPDTLCQGDTTTLSVAGGNSYTWSPATGLSTTTGSSVMANPTLTTTYFITAADTNGCSTTDSSILKVKSCASGIEQLAAKSNNLLIYPNPTSGQFIVNLSGNQNGYTVEVYNVLGEKIYESVLSNSQDVIDLSTHPTGMYFIYLKSDEGIEVGKVLLTK